MATYEQLIDARRADAAGDGPAARRFVELARDQRPAAGAPAENGAPGEGPWTKYQKPTDGPWTKYQHQGATAGAESGKAANQFIVTAPDGKRYKVTGENAEGAVAAVRKMAASGSAQADQAPGNDGGWKVLPPDGAPSDSGWKIMPPDETGPQQPQLTRADAMRARGLTSPNPSAANAQAGAGIQEAQDQAALDANPGLSRLVEFNKGLPLIGSYTDELAGAVGGDRAKGYTRGLQGAMEREHPGQSAALQIGGGVVGSIPALALPGLSIVRAGSVGQKAAAGASLGGLTGGAEGAAYGYGLGTDEEGNRGSEAAKQAILQALLGTATGGVLGGVAGAAQRKAAVNAAPSVDALKGAAEAQYSAGRATGMTAPGALTQGLDAKLTDIATKNGLISRSGALAPKYEGIGHALRMARDYAGKEMSPEQMQQVRRALQAAAQSSDSTEARIGTQMLKEFDGGIRNPLVPEFQEGDKLYSRAMRGEEIDRAMQIAKKGRKSAGEAAISGEFQGLVRKGIRGDLTYPPELEAAVERAANGGTGRMITSTVGGAAPTIRSGFGMFGGPGVGGMVGGYLGGPVGAMAGAGATSGVGLIAKLLANRMANSDARAASAIARNGGPLVAQDGTSDAMRAIIAALLARNVPTAAGAMPGL